MKVRRMNQKKMIQRAVQDQRSFKERKRGVGESIGGMTDREVTGSIEIRKGREIKKGMNKFSDLTLLQRIMS